MVNISTQVLLLLLPLVASAAPAPQVLSASPTDFAAEGGSDAAVAGTGFTAPALCRISAAPGGTTHQINSSGAVFEAHSINATALTCAGAPSVVAPGPGLLHVSFDGGATWVGGLQVAYFEQIEVAIGRRPYIKEASGNLLVRSHKSLRGVKLLVKAELPAMGAAAAWRWGDVSGGTDSVLNMDFDSTLGKNDAPVHNDLIITITWGQHEKVVKRRRFHRVPPLPAGSTVEPVQIDHAVAGLRVAGAQWIGQGWYVAAASNATAKRPDSVWNGDWKMLADVITYDLVPKGINQGMIYGIQFASPADQIALLDACAAAGFKVMYSVGSGSVSINHGGPFDDPALLTDLKNNVSLVKDHPALLGYYICDDCCSNNVNISLQSQVYQLLKNIDPYHVTIGAVNCGNSWMFTDQTPSWLAPEQDDHARSLPEARQPALQLSLDVVMQENYGGSLAVHKSSGTWASGVGSDGFFRHGVTFEHLINCPGSFSWMGTPRAWLSAMWLGVITANMYSDLSFIYREDEWKNHTNLADQQSVFASQVLALQLGIAALFGSFPGHPEVSVADKGHNIVARAWSVPADEHPDCAGFLVVVNTAEQGASQLEVEISMPSGTSAQFASATRMFNGNQCLNTTTANVSNKKVEDEIGEGSHNVYCLRNSPCA
jgi:hypothetical protein